MVNFPCPHCTWVNVKVWIVSYVHLSKLLEPLSLLRSTTLTKQISNALWATTHWPTDRPTADSSGYSLDEYSDVGLLFSNFENHGANWTEYDTAVILHWLEHIQILGVIGGLSSESSASPHCVKHKAQRHVLHTDIWHGLGGQLRNLWWGKFSKLSPPMTPNLCTELH